MKITYESRKFLFLSSFKIGLKLCLLLLLLCCSKKKIALYGEQQVEITGKDERNAFLNAVERGDVVSVEAMLEAGKISVDKLLDNIKKVT